MKKQRSCEDGATFSEINSRNKGMKELIFSLTPLDVFLL